MKVECSLIHNSIRCTNIKINHLQTEIANTKTSLQQKLHEPTFANLQNTIFNNKRENISPVQEHPDQKPQGPHLQILHNNLQDGLQDNQHFQHCSHLLYFIKYPGQVGNQPLQEGPNTWRKVFTTERPNLYNYPSNHPHQGIHLHYYCGSCPGRWTQWCWLQWPLLWCH